MSKTTPEAALFNLETVFEVDDYLFAYEDDLTDERSDAEVASLVKLLELDSPMKILDLACGFGRHTNCLAALGHSVTGVDYMPGFLAVAQKKAAEMGVQVYIQPGTKAVVEFAVATPFDTPVLALRNGRFATRLQDGKWLQFQEKRPELLLEQVAE